MASEGNFPMKIGNRVKVVDYFLGPVLTVIGFGTVVALRGDAVVVNFPALGYNLQFSPEASDEEVAPSKIQLINCAEWDDFANFQI